jgi:hypothetical protein
MQPPLGGVTKIQDSSLEKKDQKRREIEKIEGRS